MDNTGKYWWIWDLLKVQTCPEYIYYWGMHFKPLCKMNSQSFYNSFTTVNKVLRAAPVKDTSASLSMPSSWMLSLSDLELPLDLFMLRKYWPHLCRPASFFSRFSLARLFWNQTWGGERREISFLKLRTRSKRVNCQPARFVRHRVRSKPFRNEASDMM